MSETVQESDTRDLLAGVRNAARDVAKAMERFDRDMTRFQRLGREAVEKHGQEAVTLAVCEAVRGHPQLAAHLQRLGDGMKSAAPSQEADHA